MTQAAALIDYLSQLERKSDRDCQKFAVNCWAKMLDRPVTFADFQSDMLTKLAEWAKSRYTAATCYSIDVRLRRLWKQLHAAGIVKEPAPQGRPRGQWRKVDKERIWNAKPKLVGLRDVRLLRDFVVNFYVPLTGEKADNTLRLYEVAIEHFERHLNRPALIDDLQDDMLARHLAARLAEGVSPCTANRELHKLLAFGRLAFRKRVLPEWPTVALAREPRREPMGWLEPELARLWRVIGQLEGHVGDIPAKLWWRALHEVIWWTGERITPLLELEWANVDLESGWVLFLAETRKGRTGDIRRKLPATAVEALRCIQSPNRDLVFPWDRHPGLLWVRYKRILRAAGLPADRRSMFHRMRRSTASHYAAAGGDAVRLLDHSSPKVTRAYIDQRIATVTQPADVLFAPGGKDGDE